MGASWKRLCSGKAFATDETGITLSLAEGRSHRMIVEELAGDYLLRAIVLRHSEMERTGIPAVRIWEMNRSLNLVGFRIDAKGRLIGEARVPMAGLTPAEFQIVATNLAVECDRYEYMLTWRDIE